jgi:uncharacterized protein (TIGR03118 family)
MEGSMKRTLSRLGKLPVALLAVLALGGAGSLSLLTTSADAAPTAASSGGTVLQTNLVSDLPGTAAVTDASLVNPWGISESSGSPFWISDNNAGVSTLYQVPGASNTPVSVNSLVVHIPTPVSSTGGAPTGTVFNTAQGAFPVSGLNSTHQPASASSLFLFATEDGTILGWNPGIDPTGQFAGPNGISASAAIAVDNSGNNFTNPDPAQETGAVYKGLAIATSSTPIVPTDANSTALLYASDFRAGAINVYNAQFHKVTGLPTGAFTDSGLPVGYAPFGVQVLNGKVYVTYALQNATRHDDVAGPHHGFVDVFNLDGTPGLIHGQMRLISGGVLDSPWGLAIAPAGFAGLAAPNGDPVLLVGNFGDGFINAFDATTGSPMGQLKDPDGEPIHIDGLWALKVGNGAHGGAADTVYFTAGSFGETHGLFGSLSTVAAGSPEGPAESQLVQANLDVVQLAVQQLAKDASSGTTLAAIQQDITTLQADTVALAGSERAFAQDTVADATHSG